MREIKEVRDSTLDTKTETKERVYLVPPVRLAFAHLIKPYDLAHIVQVALATGHCELFLVGNGLRLDNPKVISKVASWNIAKKEIENLPVAYISSVAALKDISKERLVGTSPHATTNAFDFAWQDTDLIVLGPPSGFSKRDANLMDEIVNIPTLQNVPFLTIPTVVPTLTYHILTQRGLWSKLER
ncbi:hypothetical protein KKI19_00580 [Patescibacteria group bacterium]|nr:hypothetical protein [Patescibacteria group bacterium]